MRKTKANLSQRNVIDQQFDIDKLKSIDNAKAAMAYCLRTLKFFSNGATRALFFLDDDTVVKIGLSSAGNDANKLEAKYAQTLNAVPKVFFVNENGSVLILQRVIPIDKYNIKSITGLSSKVFLSLVWEVCREESLDDTTHKYWAENIVLKPYLRMDLAKQLLKNVLSGNNTLLKNFVQDLIQYLRSADTKVKRTIMSSDLCHRIINFGYDKKNNKLLLIDSGIDLDKAGECYLNMKDVSRKIKKILNNKSFTSKDILEARAKRLKAKIQKITN